MYSKHILFEEIVEGVKDDTGIENLSNLYPKIRRLIYRCEQDIGFGNSLVLKKITYSEADGTIDCKRAKLPDDIVKIESFGMCQEGLCPGDYKIQGNYIFLCKPISSFSFIYYTMLCDGEGNPMVTQNHKEAVVSGVSYYMYKPRVYNGNDGSQSHLQTLERYYHDRVGEARGDDAMPSTKEEWSNLANILKRSYSQTLIYDNTKECYCCIEDSSKIEKNPLINYWQFDNTLSDISIAPTFDLNYLSLKPEISLEEFLNGLNFEYGLIGRIAFSIQNIEEDFYSIFDIYDNDITSIAFDTYYNQNLKTQIYISKEFYTFSEIFFKLKTL